MKFRIIMQHVKNISENKAQAIQFTCLGRHRRCVSQDLQICLGVCLFFGGPYWGAHASSQIERFIWYLSLADLLWYIWFVMRVPSRAVLTTYPARNKKQNEIQVNVSHGLLSWSIGFASVYFARLLLINSSLRSCHVMPHSHDINPGPTANE